MEIFPSAHLARCSTSNNPPRSICCSTKTKPYRASAIKLVSAILLTPRTRCIDSEVSFLRSSLQKKNPRTTTTTLHLFTHSGDPVMRDLNPARSTPVTILEQSANTSPVYLGCDRRTLLAGLPRPHHPVSKLVHNFPYLRALYLHYTRFDLLPQSKFSRLPSWTIIINQWTRRGSSPFLRLKNSIWRGRL